METLLLVTVLVGTLVLLGFSAVLLRRVSAASQVDVKAEVADQLERFNTALGQKISVSTADMATPPGSRLKGTCVSKSQTAYSKAFQRFEASVEQQLATGREEQNRSLSDGRSEMTGSLVAHDTAA